jgi:hypothetical protein
LESGALVGDALVGEALVGEALAGEAFASGALFAAGVFSLIGLLLICHLSYKNLNNFLLIFLIFLNNPQLEVYHKYYDPMLLILFFTLFNLNIKKILLEKKILILYFFNGLFLFLNFLR